MGERAPLSANRTLFDLGARLGSLEGYLYAEAQVEKKYLPGWIGNIEREYETLPAEVKGEVAHDYREIWRKVAALLVKIYGEADTTTGQVKRILDRLGGT